jgi:hypothetical protein
MADAVGGALIGLGRRALQTVIAQLMKMLTRRGVLIEDMGQAYLA